MSTVTPPTLEEIEAVFFALAHQARRHIVLLLGHTGGELSSGYLAKRFGHSWPTTTRPPSGARRQRARRSEPPRPHEQLPLEARLRQARPRRLASQSRARQL